MVGLFLPLGVHLKPKTSLLQVLLQLSRTVFSTITGVCKHHLNWAIMVSSGISFHAVVGRLSDPGTSYRIALFCLWNLDQCLHVYSLLIQYCVFFHRRSLSIPTSRKDMIKHVDTGRNIMKEMTLPVYQNLTTIFIKLQVLLQRRKYAALQADNCGKLTQLTRGWP